MKIRSLLSLFRSVRIKKFDKGELLINQGSTEKEVFFIRKGLVRSYYTNKKLEDITFQLYPEYNALVNIHALLFDEPSKFIYEAYEPTKAYIISYEALMELTSKNSDLLEMNRRFIGRKALKQVFQRVESFVCQSPEERYEKYVRDYPNIINRAPDKYIANVLGITPVSLSRIRNRISTKK